jgi:UDP-N-acetylmuramoyl-L-alanyl-D-glutamate--2,6-diaminopimelate ligase
MTSSPPVAPGAGLSLAEVAGLLRDHGLLVEGPQAGGELRVGRVEQDSRRVAEGDLFLAWKGTRADGHRFLTDARDRGAAAAVVEQVDPAVGIPQLQVRDGRWAAALVAMAVEGDPGKGMLVTAVTGTNGKTTTVLLIRHLLSQGWRSVALGTLGVVGPNGEVRDGSGGLTTPGPVELARTFRALQEEGVTALSLEASSHALDQRRLDGLRVDVACFTNLTRDHLDYHGTLEAYFAAKAHLLELLAPDGVAVVNGRDPAWSGLPPISGRMLLLRMEGSSVGGVPKARERLPDLTAREIHLDGTGARFFLEERGEVARVHLPLLGRFNVENALCAAGVARAAGMPLPEIAQELSRAPAPRGRLEVVERHPVPVIVDYAHTPDALRRALETLRPLYPGRLIVVFGAGGDRDRSKRPEMGDVVARGADLAIVTSDNPRTEDPDRIVDDILAGMDGANLERVVDRREAIGRALEVAREGDAILLAGKGHETYQVVGTEVRPFDERVVVRELLGRREGPRGHGGVA